MSFDPSYTTEKKRCESAKLRAKYPDRCPIIVQFSPAFENSSTFKTKYLVPDRMICSEFQYVLRKHMSTLSPEEAIFMFVNKSEIPLATSPIGEIYARKKSECGFLYLTVTKENTFGSHLNSRITRSL